MADQAGHIIKNGHMYKCSCRGSGLCRLACCILESSTSGAMVDVSWPKETSEFEQMPSTFACRRAAASASVLPTLVLMRNASVGHCLRFTMVDAEDPYMCPKPFDI